MCFGSKCGRNESELCINGNSLAAVCGIAAAAASFSRSFHVLIRRLAGMRWTFQLRNIFVVWNPVGLFALFVWPEIDSERKREREKYLFVRTQRQCLILFTSHYFNFSHSLVCFARLHSEYLRYFPVCVCLWVSVCARHLRFCVIIKVKLQTEKFVHAQSPYATNMRTMDRLVGTNKKRRKKINDSRHTSSHTWAKWNIFISFQQEILKHKIESEFSSTHSCNFTKLLLWHDTHTQWPKPKRLRKFGTATHTKKSHRIESKNIFRQSNNCSECWWCQKRGCGYQKIQFSQSQNTHTHTHSREHFSFLFEKRFCAFCSVGVRDDKLWNQWKKNQPQNSCREQVFLVCIATICNEQTNQIAQLLLDVVDCCSQSKSTSTFMCLSWWVVVSAALSTAVVQQFPIKLPFVFQLIWPPVPQRILLNLQLRKYIQVTTNVGNRTRTQSVHEANAINAITRHTYEHTKFEERKVHFRTRVTLNTNQPNWKKEEEEENEPSMNRKWM